jgi:hypothetical protein
VNSVHRFAHGFDVSTHLSSTIRDHLDQGKTAMQLASPAHLSDRLLRVTRNQRLVSGCPSNLGHLLLVADLHPASRSAIEFAIELTEQFDPRLTLMHGGELRSLPEGWMSDSQDDPDQMGCSLLCLLWQLRQRCPEIGICTVHSYLPGRVLQVAAEQRADLLVIPENLFGRFLPLVSGSSSCERVIGAPCPVAVVEDHATDEFAPEAPHFR